MLSLANHDTYRQRCVSWSGKGVMSNCVQKERYRACAERCVEGARAW